MISIKDRPKECFQRKTTFQEKLREVELEIWAHNLEKQAEATVGMKRIEAPKNG